MKVKELKEAISKFRYHPLHVYGADPFHKPLYNGRITYIHRIKDVVYLKCTDTEIISIGSKETIRPLDVYAGQVIEKLDKFPDDCEVYLLRRIKGTDEVLTKPLHHVRRFNLSYSLYDDEVPEIIKKAYNFYSTHL